MAAVFFDGAGFGFGHKVNAGVALKHDGPVRVVGAQRGRDFEAAWQLEEEAHPLVDAAVLRELAFYAAVGQNA